jgi:drug/metabolite transporter (DMT)-like permease
MNHEFFIALLAGLGGMLGWGISDLFAKKTIDAIGDVKTLVLAHFFGSALVILAIIYRLFVTHGTVALPSTQIGWLSIALFGVVQAVVYILLYVGFGKGQIAVLNPIFSSFSGIVAIISILFLGEHAPPLLLGGLAFVFGGIMLMNVDINALRNKSFVLTQVPGFTYIAFGTMLAAVWTLGWNSVVHDKDWLAYGASMYLCMTIALVLYAYATQLSLSVPYRWAWKYLAVIGVFEAGAYLAISGGYALTNATAVVAVLSGAFSLPTIIGARVWLNEHTTRLQLWGSLIIVLGVIIIALV